MFFRKTSRNVRKKLSKLKVFIWMISKLAPCSVPSNKRISFFSSLIIQQFIAGLDEMPPTAFPTWKSPTRGLEVWLFVRDSAVRRSEEVEEAKSPRGRRVRIIKIFSHVLKSPLIGRDEIMLSLVGAWRCERESFVLFVLYKFSEEILFFFLSFFLFTSYRKW